MTAVDFMLGQALGSWFSDLFLVPGYGSHRNCIQVTIMEHLPELLPLPVGISGLGGSHSCTMQREQL